jgi:hypothetical protein
MADVLAIFGILSIFGVAFPGLQLTWRLLLPGIVEAGRQRLAYTPWACFWSGLFAAGALAFPAFILATIGAGPAQFLAWLIAGAGLAFASLGAAGLTALLAERLLPLLGPSASPAGSFVRAAVALELAAFFPVLGWVIAMPAFVLLSLGAAVFALLRWTPRQARQPAPASLPQAQTS